MLVLLTIKLVEFALKTVLWVATQISVQFCLLVECSKFVLCLQGSEVTRVQLVLSLLYLAPSHDPLPQFLWSSLSQSLFSGSLDREANGVSVIPGDTFCKIFPDLQSTPYQSIESLSDYELVFNSNAFSLLSILSRVYTCYLHESQPGWSWVSHTKNRSITFIFWETAKDLLIKSLDHFTLLLTMYDNSSSVSPLFIKSVITDLLVVINCMSV